MRKVMIYFARRFTLYKYRFVVFSILLHFVSLTRMRATLTNQTQVRRRQLDFCYLKQLNFRWKKKSMSRRQCCFSGSTPYDLCLLSFELSELCSIFQYIASINCCFKTQLILVRTTKKVKQLAFHSCSIVF